MSQQPTSATGPLESVGAQPAEPEALDLWSGGQGGLPDLRTSVGRGEVRCWIGIRQNCWSGSWLQVSGENSFRLRSALFVVGES